MPDQTDPKDATIEELTRQLARLVDERDAASRECMAMRYRLDQAKRTGSRRTLRELVAALDMLAWDDQPARFLLEEMARKRLRAALEDARRVLRGAPQHAHRTTR